MLQTRFGLPIVVASCACLMAIGVVADRLAWLSNLRVVIQRSPSQFPNSLVVPPSMRSRPGSLLSVYTEARYLHDPDYGLLTNPTRWRSRVGAPRHGVVFRRRSFAVRRERRSAGARRRESDRITGQELSAVFSPRVRIRAVPSGDAVRREGRSTDSTRCTQRSATQLARRPRRPLVAFCQSTRVRHRA